MPSRERLSEALEADGCGDPSRDRGNVMSPDEEAVVLAEARAQAARARAIQLSEKADAIAGNRQETTEAADGGGIDGVAVDDRVTEAEPPPAISPAFPLRRRWLHRPRRKPVTAGVAAALVCGSLAGSGYLLWCHRPVAHERQRAAEFAAAARREAITLMSIDAGKARDDVQRIIDNSTGRFKAGMLLHAEDLVKAVEQSKVSTKVAVEAVAVESMTDDSAVVLVAAKAEVANPDKDKPPPHSWRLVMTLQTDAGQPKVSTIEVLP
jgi:Mce-associated membrane protein